jgi:isopentenyl-diphosphate delta-isomerase
MRLVETIDDSGAIGLPVQIIEAHRDGMAHRAISIVIWNPSRTKMLITQRSAAKATWPGFWSNAVCSHPLPREPYVAAARRRLVEELRIHCAVAPAFRMFYGPVCCPVSGAIEHEMDYVFYAKLPEGIILKPSPKEISSVRWVDQAQLEAMRESGSLTPWFVMILKRVGWAN